jgi:hypothetical protein
MDSTVIHLGLQVMNGSKTKPTGRLEGIPSWGSG